MEKYTFICWFENQTLVVHALNDEEAIILAKAERIKLGLSYHNFTRIKKLEERMER